MRTLGLVFLTLSSFVSFAQKKLHERALNLLANQCADTEYCEELNRVSTFFSEKQYEQAYQVLHSIRFKPNSEESFLNLLILGKIYEQKDLIEEAIQTYEKAHLFYKLYSPKIDAEFSSIQSVLGYLYLRQSAHLMALRCFYHRLAELPKIPPRERLDLFHNMGITYLLMEQYDSSERYLLKGLELQNLFKDSVGLTGLYTDIANLYYEQYLDKEAIVYYQRALEVAQKGKNIPPLSLKRALYNMAIVEEDRLNFKSALAYRKKYEKLQKELWDRDKVWELAEIEKGFAIERREKEIESLEKDKALNQNYVFITLILLVLSVVVILYFRQRFKGAKFMAEAQRKDHNHRVNELLKNKETETLQSLIKGKEEERKHLAKELHNHLGSLLATIKVNLNGLDSHQQDRHQTLMNLVDQACQDVRNLSHELNMGISENFGLIPTITELINHLKKSNELEVEFTASLSQVFLDAHTEILIYRIVQELISNVLKHSQANKLSISLTGFETDHMINILVQDNGLGFDPQKASDTSKGMGLNSIQEMVERMDGALFIDSSLQSGTTINIDLPIIETESTLEN